MRVSRAVMTPGTRTLAQEDMSRVLFVRSNASGAAKARELLNASDIKPGCVIRFITPDEGDEETVRLFMGLCGPYQAMLSQLRVNNKAGGRWVVSWDEARGTCVDLLIALVSPKPEEHIHAMHADYKMRTAVQRRLIASKRYKQYDKARQHFAGIGVEDILEQEHGTYWREATFNKLLEELLQTLPD